MDITIWHLLIPNIVTLAVSITSAAFNLATVKSSSKATVYLETHKEKTKTYLELYDIFSSFFYTDKVDYEQLLSVSYRAMLYTPHEVDVEFAYLWKAVIKRYGLGSVPKDETAAQEIADTMQKIAQLLKKDMQSNKTQYSRKRIMLLPSKAPEA